MSNFQDLKKITTLMQKLNDNRIVIGTSKGWHSKHWGKSQTLEKYRIFSLEQSKGPRNISNDELEQKLKNIVYQTSHLDAGKTRDQIYQKINILYPQNYKIVFVWNAGQICRTSFKNSYAWVQFRTTQDKKYGHDVLVLIH